MHAFLGSVLLVVAAAGVVSGVRAVLAACGEARGSVIAASTLAVLAAVPLSLQPLIGLKAAVLVLGIVAAIVGRTLAPIATTTTTAFWPSSARLLSALLFGLLAFVAVGTFLWDEGSTHLPLAGAIARDMVPLEHPLFPGQPLRYHAGFDVVAGVVRAFTLLPLDLCIDVVTLAAIGLLLWGIHDLACALAPRSGPWALVVVLLAGGPVAALLADGWGMALPGKGLFPAAWVSGAFFPPLVVTNVFQHPQGLAMPIACATLMVASVPSLRRFAVAAVLIVLCSRVQIVFAAVTGLAVLVLALRARDVPALIVLVVAAAVCGLDSGFTGAAGGQLVWGGAFARDGAAALVHEPLAFGVSLGAPVLGWVLWRRARSDLVVALAVAGTFGFIVANVISYARSWDIVKLFGVSAFFTHFLLAAWLASARRNVAVAVVVVSCWSGGVWLVRHGPGNGVIAPTYREQGLADDVAAFADDVAPLIPASARVFSPDLRLARTGVVVPGTDWTWSRDTAALLLDRPRVEAMTEAWTRAKIDLDDDALRTLQAEYVVVRARDPLLVTLQDRERFEPITGTGRYWRLFVVWP
ncbi:MAG: hypothetical protein Q8O67_30575 [Deltaproteobacteria bacterium]|nr:hypothetical protein [Deltaproteobacteria bacterium]